jgi:hypothetical protein
MSGMLIVQINLLWILYLIEVIFCPRVGVPVAYDDVMLVFYFKNDVNVKPRNLVVFGRLFGGNVKNC